MKEIFYDHNKKLSYARVFGTIVLIWYMILATYITIETKNFPDIPSGLAMLLVGLYGINKAGPLLDQRTGNK